MNMYKLCAAAHDMKSGTKRNNGRIMDRYLGWNVHCSVHPYYMLLFLTENVLFD